MGRRAPRAASLTLFGAPSESSKKFDTMYAETAEACQTLQNNGRRGIASQRPTSNPS